MATPPANVKVYSSAIPLGVWGGLSLVGIAGLLMWALPQARLLVGVGLVAGVLFSIVLVGLRRRSAAHADSGSKPLHLRD